MDGIYNTTMELSVTNPVVSVIHIIVAIPNLQGLKKYWGKLDLDIDLDALRGRNDPR